MKDYMANGRFSRGITQVHADAALVFVGNLNHPVETLVASSAMDLFQPLPKEFDLALIDRFHFYLPGWEVPKASRDLLTDRYGFVTDYLAEALHWLRKDNRFDALNGEFRLGAHVEGRDANGIRRTVGGLLKLLHPHGEWTRDELRSYLELAMEGRRRVKEQLKKRGSFEFYRTSFSYLDEADGREITIGVPEKGGEGAISRDPLAPGAVYTATVDGESRVSLLRLEVTAAPGTGKLRTPAGLSRGLRESLNRAWAYLQSIKDRIGLTPAIAVKDFAVEAVDLSGGGADADCGIAFFVAIMSALQNRSVQGGTVILGDLTIQGNIRAPVSITEPLQVALDNGALRALVPVANKKQVALLPEEVVEKLDIVFYGDVDRAVVKGLVD
jgi:ATP-dependent Lon protease